MFLNVVNESRISYDGFDTNIMSIARKAGAALSEKFSADWGIGLVDFIIEAFVISDEDKARVEAALSEHRQENKIKEHLAELERLDDKKWEREKYLLNLQATDREAYYEVLKVTGETAPKGSFCPKCGHSVEATEAFCSNCGQKLSGDTTCPDCGKKNAADAKFCGGCGKKL